MSPSTERKETVSEIRDKFNAGKYRLRYAPIIISGYVRGKEVYFHKNKFDQDEIEALHDRSNFLKNRTMTDRMKVYSTGDYFFVVWWVSKKYFFSHDHFDSLFLRFNKYQGNNLSEAKMTESITLEEALANFRARLLCN